MVVQSEASKSMRKVLSKDLLIREHVLSLSVTFHTHTRIRKTFISFYLNSNIIGPKTTLQHNDTTQHSNHWSGLDVQLLLQLHLAMGPSQKPLLTPFHNLIFFQLYIYIRGNLELRWDTPTWPNLGLAFWDQVVVSPRIMAIVVNHVGVLDPLHGPKLVRAQTSKARWRARRWPAWGRAFTSATLNSEVFVPTNEGLVFIISFVFSTLCCPRRCIPYWPIHIHWPWRVCGLTFPWIPSYWDIIHKKSAYICCFHYNST